MTAPPIEWVELQPNRKVGRVGAAPFVTVRIRELVSGDSSLQMVLSKTLMQTLQPGPVKVLCAPNKPELIKVVADDRGAFRITPPGGVIGVSRLTCSVPAGLPARADIAQAFLLEFDAEGFSLELPIGEWKRAEIAARPKPPKPEKVEPVNPNDRPLDAAEYLRLKGHTVDKLPSGLWRLDGDSVEVGVILMRVNHYRTRSGLNPVKIAAIAA